jgi:dTDP-4-dehydrorhamnose reductase
MNFLIVGVDGLIGKELSIYLESMGESVLGTTRKRDTISEERIYLDLGEDIAEWKIPHEVSVAYLCASVSKLHMCRQDPVKSSLINVQNTVKVARYLASKGAFLVVPSTNLVFDGTIPFRKADEKVSPRTEYGRQKAEIDRQLLALEDQVSIVRFSKVIGPNMSLIKGWIHSLRNGEVIHPFSNMSIAPVALSLAIEVLYQVGKRKLPGICQVSDNQDVTYAQIAFHIAERIGASHELIQPLTWEESGVDLEAVPTYTTLDMSRVRTELGIHPGDVWSIIDSLFG